MREISRSGERGDVWTAASTAVWQSFQSKPPWGATTYDYAIVQIGFF